MTSRERRVASRERHAVTGGKGIAVWLTGLSGAGKSTIAYAVEKQLILTGTLAYVLDGDVLRTGLNKGLGYTPEDRQENVRRIGEVARLFTDAGLIVLIASISPSRADRAHVRSMFEPSTFIEVFVDCPIDECERRDPKGLYKRARAGEIAQFTGISAPYEPPLKPELKIYSSMWSLERCCAEIIAYIEAARSTAL
ncbi:adenylyl-sulfate kinase [Paenibacillus sp. YYML68]|uniref:adenylyl-sulfate kinase n=1 Tax=Paenibacillus sp. YYML68 TaxID=2909250 RepID=UPI002490F6D2|nr:adenylyl-sulfate kinase [Paenibacillus sp. YYML68]